MKYKHKIALYFALSCSLILGLFSFVIYFSVSKYNEEQFEARLEDRAFLNGQLLLEKDELSQREYENISSKQEQLRKLPDEDLYFVRKNNNFFDFSHLPEPYKNFNFKNELNHHLDVYFHKHQNRITCFLLYEDNQGTYIIITSAVNRKGNADLNYIGNLLIIMFLLTLTAVGGFALFFADTILNPLKKVVTKMKHISARNLKHPIAVNKNHDQIYELVVTFNEMLQRLQNTFEFQNQFIHNASHELRTPLTVILGETEYALADKNIDSSYKKSLLIIQHQTQKLKNLINSLLKLSSVEQDKTNSYNEIRFDEVVHESLKNIFLAHSNVDIKVVYQKDEMDENYFLCYGNADWLEIAFINLIENAIKFSENKPIKIVLSNTENLVAVKVIDQGRGIEGEKIDDLKNPFYRGKNAYLTDGTGLGLSLVQKIIDLHQGELSIQSNKNQGTIVEIKIPKNINKKSL